MRADLEPESAWTHGGAYSLFWPPPNPTLTPPCNHVFNSSMNSAWLLWPPSACPSPSRSALSCWCPLPRSQASHPPASSRGSSNRSDPGVDLDPDPPPSLAYWSYNPHTIQCSSTSESAPALIRITNSMLHIITPVLAAMILAASSIGEEGRMHYHVCDLGRYLGHRIQITRCSVHTAYPITDFSMQIHPVGCALCLLNKNT